MQQTYVFDLPVLVSGTERAPFVRDYHHPRDPKLDAMVRSGDYFITLATMLETIASELTENQIAVTSLALAKLSEDLGYVQKHYQIVPKKRADPLTELG